VTDSATVSQFVPLIVQQLENAGRRFGVTPGIGPVSKDSLPLYAGRYVDPLTGAVRTLPKPSMKYVNPTDFQSLVLYNMARLVYKWNSYVRSEQAYLSLLKIAASGKLNKLFNTKTMNNRVMARARKQYKGLAINIMKGKRPYDMD